MAEIKESYRTEEREYIKWAAIRSIRDDDKEVIFKSYCHSNIYDIFLADDKHKYFNKEEGFLTNKGRFVDRITAAKIAGREEGPLQSWMMFGNERYGRE